MESFVSVLNQPLETALYFEIYPGYQPVYIHFTSSSSPTHNHIATPSPVFFSGPNKGGGLDTSA